jgi:hypothetical protein
VLGWMDGCGCGCGWAASERASCKAGEQGTGLLGRQARWGTGAGRHGGVVVLLEYGGYDTTV